MFVKICGITNADDARAAIDAGADALGFNFWRPGCRYIAPEQAAEIISALDSPTDLWKVGVFVDEALATVIQIARTAGLTAVQLHGAETPEFVSALGPQKKVKAVRMDNGFHAAQLRAFDVDAFLLDGAGVTPGGTGRPFDWRRAVAAKSFGRVILAGGLTPDNVADAIRAVRPWGVDVASGVERQPGKKDHVRIREFILAVRKAEKQ